MKMYLGAALMLLATTGNEAAAKTAKPPKAYLVAEIEVTDAEAYRAYAVQAGPIITACGGTYLARGGKVEGLEGEPPRARFAVVEFKSFDAAKACYGSKGYQAIVPLRQKASKSRFWLSEGLPARK